MYFVTDDTIKKIAVQINAGHIGVIPTDTIYGIVGRADNPAVIEQIYTIKQRDYNKPFIVLVGDINDLKKLNISLNVDYTDVLSTIWPGPVSVIFPCPDASMEYLTRGLQSMAVRLPKPAWLQKLLKLTGPIVATSANKSGQLVSHDLEKIKSELPGLDFYIPGDVSDSPSRLARMSETGNLDWLARN